MKTPRHRDSGVSLGKKTIILKNPPQPPFVKGGYNKVDYFLSFGFPLFRKEAYECCSPPLKKGEKGGF
jgi:hypothetical protein